LTFFFSYKIAYPKVPGDTGISCSQSEEKPKDMLESNWEMIIKKGNQGK